MKSNLSEDLAAVVSFPL
uniref:Uncharacterized protein n=1 Tax=Anguilla anguilla TaxID=7936 RepID=A0A0E9R0C0_ANGAN